jgi:hypothetical protein
MNAPINKIDQYKRWESGEFGNRVNVWSIDEYLESNFNAPVGLRYKSPGSSFCKIPCYTKLEVQNSLKEFCTEGAERSKFNVNEAILDQDVKFQGEIFRDEIGLRLFGSFTQKPMRIALLDGVEYLNIRAKLLLEYICNSKSYTMLMELLDKYDDGIIEFTVCNRNIGVLPNHSVCIWELRGGY